MWALYIVHFEFWLYFMGPSVIGIKLKSALEAKVVCHINRVKTLILIPFRKRLFADRVSANKKLFADTVSANKKLFADSGVPIEERKRLFADRVSAKKSYLKILYLQIKSYLQIVAFQ